MQNNECIADQEKFFYPYSIMNENKDDIQYIMPKRSKYWWQHDEVEICNTHQPQPGDKCPECDNGILAYDGLFVLTCLNCGKAAEAGAFT